MEFHTHSLVGIVLYTLLIRAVGPLTPWRAVLALGMLVASHFFIDFFAQFTYHPKDPHWSDRFWVSAHILAAVWGIVVVIVFGKAYWWVMLGASLPDIVDWVILRPIIKKTPPFHHIMEVLRAKVFPNMDYSERKAGYVLEAGVDLLMIGLLIWLL